MGKITPTEEQKKIFHFVKYRDENLLIKARAGCGKTHVLVALMKLIEGSKRKIFLAFNRHIRDELITRLPEGTHIKTIYGVGYAAIKRKYGDKIEYDEFKLIKHINKLSARWELNKEFDSKEKKDKYLSDIRKIVDLCRLTLTLKPEHLFNLAKKHDILLNSENDIKRVFKILNSMTIDRKTFDYVDMVYLPAIDNSIWMFPYDYVLVDEMQDLNLCQFKIVEKLLKGNKKISGRLIAVGDESQAIYAFNGAGGTAFKRIEQYPNMKSLPLTTSFRCAKNIIKEAQKIVPDIKAMNNAPDGVVRSGNVLSETNDGDFVLCRTTKPLVKLFFELLEANKKATIKGKKFGTGLNEMIGESNNIESLIKHWKDVLSQYKIELNNSGVLNPLENEDYLILKDNVDTLIFLAERSINILDLKTKIKNIFSDDITTGIMLSTVHKSKGLEAERVFIIRRDLLPHPNARKKWQKEQEENLEYIAITRAKLELVYDNVWTDEDDQ